MRSLNVALFALAALAHAVPALAQTEFPARQPVKLVVTFAPGGGADAAARAISDKLSEKLGQSVIVENRPGAGGTIATSYVAKSPADGYTVLFTVSSHSINQALMPTLPFDTEKDLRGVTLVGQLPQVLAVHPSVPANTLGEWLALSAKDSKFRQYATGGVGSPGHFAGAVLESMSKHPLTHVGYKGAGPAMTDVIGNQVPAVLGTLGGIIPHLKTGKLKPIAITSQKRTSLLPNVQTIGETVSGYEADTWVGMFVPTGTPAAVIGKLHAATAAALADPAVKTRLDGQGINVVAGTGAELDKLVSQEIKLFTRVVREQGIKAE
jgi:tripartite-type tricarboxylate transporter receptor subunit TctC